MNVTWIKCRAGNWCLLEKLNLDNIGDVAGVYIIWHQGSFRTPSRVVFIGQGVVRYRLEVHRHDKEILLYRTFGKLRVTWAEVHWSVRDAVERYLVDTWPPLIGSPSPNALPIAVN